MLCIQLGIKSSTCSEVLEKCGDILWELWRTQGMTLIASLLNQCLDVSQL